MLLTLSLALRVVAYSVLRACESGPRNYVSTTLRRDTGPKLGRADGDQHCPGFLDECYLP
jgi:hypothetical protein